jgi:hypothetical protein
VNTVKDLFHVRYGHSLSLNRLRQVEAGRGIAFVSRSAKNNGIAAWVEPIDGVLPESAGLLTVSLRSRNHALATFLQPHRFYTAFHVYVLEPKSAMSTQEKLWWASCIEANRFRYNFGRQANRSLSDLELPTEVPDWVTSTPIPIVANPDTTGEPLVLDDVSNWAEFRLGDLFEVRRGRNVLKREMRPGKTAYVGASSANNGITAWIDLEPDWPGGQVTVASNGSIGESFYQPHPFIASGDVNVLIAKQNLSPEAALFLCTLLRQERYRFNYARKWVLSRMENSTIRLPVLNDGSPDWIRVEAMIEAIPLHQAIRN